MTTKTPVKMNLLLKGLVQCSNCNATGIWSGFLHSSVCSSCNGLGLLASNGEALGYKEAITILNKRHAQIKHEIIQAMKYCNSKIDLNYDSYHYLDKEQESFLKSPPRFWSPKELIDCNVCDGTGVYTGIVSSDECQNCQGTGYSNASDENLPKHELIAAIALRNKKAKKLLNYLLSRPEVNNGLEKEKRALEDYLMK